ncbi:MAG TPA: S8 family serine peptidase, partial [Cytophagales bacterium]
MHRSCLLLSLLLLGPALLRAQHQPLPAAPVTARKLSPALASPGAPGGPRTVRVQVAGQTSLFRSWLAGHLPGAKVTSLPGSSNIVVVSGLDAAGLQRLLVSPWVRYVDVPNRVAREELSQDRLDLTANKITAVHDRYPALSGEGLAVSIKEKAFDKRDIDFRGRMMNPAAIPNDYSAHATMMASMAAGGGNSSPSGKGVAWRARLAHADFTELLPDDAAALRAAGISVQNHSYGVGIENYYGLEAHEYDKSTFRNPTLLHVFSSGNAGRDTSKTGPYAGIAGYGTLTGQFKMSKNTLSVGAVDRQGGFINLSSRGPAYDGRVKPELAALGEDGTSDAAALVSGISLLVQQAYRDRQGGSLPPAALVKAALLNSADDAGRPEVDFETGF